MGRQTIAGLIAALILGSFVVVASAQVTPAPPAQDRYATVWPAISTTNGVPNTVVTEWYSDIPWTQKLGTFRGNEIDEALVLPYDALGPNEQKFCTDNKLSEEDCMIETGIMNILGIYRTDTPYTLAAKCYSNLTPPQSCIEVRLQASMFWTQAAGCASTSTPPIPPCTVRPRVFGVLPQQWATIYGPSPVPPGGTYYKGYVINDGGSYAPQMPWYMGHYCDSKLTNDLQDPVCYADYLSPMNDGFNLLPTKSTSDWPNSAPFSVFPFGTGGSPAPPSNTCASMYKNTIQTTCQLVLAGFDLNPVPSKLNPMPKIPSYTPYQPYNNFLFNWFNTALTQFPTNFTDADFYRHFPWSTTPPPTTTPVQVTWGTDKDSPTDLYYQALLNPFLGQFTSVNGQPAVVNTDPPAPPGCLAPFTPLNPPDVFPAGCNNSGNMRAGHYLYPRQCSLADVARAYMETNNDTNAMKNIPKLRACGLTYELHSAGWLEEWPPYVCDITMLPTCNTTLDYSWWQAIGDNNDNMVANQYGRTSFVFAGVPGMRLPVSFGTIPTSTNGLSVYEQVHNASIFSVYLPIANEADTKNAFNGRNYGDPSDFYHTLLMTNHMESDPDEFAEGIRGKTLWHNEYRTRKMFDAQHKGYTTKFGDRTFAAAFDPTMAPAPFHNNTCDGCHVRNGSGIPINPGGTLDAALQTFMTGGTYNAGGKEVNGPADYTFTGQIRPMKLVFFDLKRFTSPLLLFTSRFDDSVYSKPLAASQAAQQDPTAVQPANSYYKNTIMNFYGDSFHVSKPGNSNYVGYNFSWNYVPLPATSNRIVVNPANGRVNQELKANCTPSPACATYQPRQVSLGAFTTPGSGCQFVSPAPPSTPWPASCDDISSGAILRAINGSPSNTQPCGSDRNGKEVPPPCVGFMLLNGKRLGNLSAIEAIPSGAIQIFQQNQIKALGTTIAGELQYNAGSRDGVGGLYSAVRECETKSSTNCYFGRFGWIGDRVSLEDQVANAAFVEMNMTTPQGYAKLPANMAFPIRYNAPDCGPADQTCVQSAKSGGNSELSERDVNRMADYARWNGNPTRSEFMVSVPDVIAGEGIFRQIGCNTCHVIDKIDITDPDDTMLTKIFRDRLKTHVDTTDPKTKVYPFLSYLGTDLLMHDMGYLSQVGNASGSIRGANGVVNPGSEGFIQKIRTPPLKGLRFNRFVTDSQLNTKSSCQLLSTDTCDPACDFLLHDGRACDAIEAAFLHDGPAIKALGVIEGISSGPNAHPGLNTLNSDQIRQLRAFLYSL
jgi:hypothetical protein